MDGSLWNSRQEYTGNFDWNQGKYYDQRQLQATLNPQLARVTIQGVQSKEQQLYSRFLASSLGKAPQVISQLIQGGGQGIGNYSPPPQPGTSALLHRSGNQTWFAGTRLWSSGADRVYSVSQARLEPLNTLPPAYAPFVRAPGSGASVSGICMLPTKPGINALDPLSTVPGALSMTNWFTSQIINYSPVRTTNINQSKQDISLAPLASAADQVARAINLTRANRCTQDYLQGDNLLQIFDTVTHQLITNDPVLTASTSTSAARAKRANQFKLEALNGIGKELAELTTVEAARNLAYPVLYDLAQQAWLDDALKPIFNLEAIIAANPTFQQIQQVITKVNKLLPYAQRLSNIITSVTGAPIFQTNGTSFDPATLTIKPEYYSTVDQINQYLPVALKLAITDISLVFGTTNITALRDTPFTFSPSFKDYVDQVNTYLPTDLKWIWGIDDPPKALFIAKGIVVSIALGLILQDQAIEVGAWIKQGISCALPTDSTVDLTTTGTEVTPTVTNTASPALGNLQTNLFSQLRNWINWSEQGAPSINIPNLVASAEQSINANLPAALQLKVDIQPNGTVNSIGLGPLNLTPGANGTWSATVPNVHDLRSGIEVATSIGIIPPDVHLLEQAYVQAQSLYQDLANEFIDPVAKLTHDPNTNAQIKGDVGIVYSTGELFPHTPGATPPIDWAEAQDVAYSISSGGNLPIQGAQALTNGRTTLKGIFLSLVSIGERIFNGRTNDDPYALVQFGRSDAGVSVSTGTIPTATGTNYSFLTALCTVNPNQTAAVPELNPIRPAPDVIAGLEYALASPVTVPAVAVVDSVDPQSNRDALEYFLTQAGLANLASDALDALDQFLYPAELVYLDSIFEFDDGSDGVASIDLFVRQNNESLVVRDTKPVSTTLQPSTIDFVNVIQAILNLPGQQILGGLLVANNLATPTQELDKVIRRRITSRLDCDSTTYYEQVLTTVANTRDYPTYANQFGVTAQPAQTYLTNPDQLLALVDQVEPRLRPAVERLRTGDVFGFWRQLIWAKANTDIYQSPLEWVRLHTLTRGYYGGSVPSANPAREWLKELSGLGVIKYA